MVTERLRRRLELRRSNAAAPHRNRYRERYDGADWLAEWEEDIEAFGEDMDGRSL
jgi:hypothetical protein